MNEVKRWEPRDTIVGFDMEPRKDGSFVLYCDHSAAQAELSALREELAGYSAANMVLRDELKTERLRAVAAVGDANEAEQRLTATEQRNADLVELLRECVTMPYKDGLLSRITAALKPTESGASE